MKTIALRIPSVEAAMPQDVQNSMPQDVQQPSDFRDIQALLMGLILQQYGKKSGE